MFIGIDHGTTAMRFAGEPGRFKISRRPEVLNPDLSDFVLLMK
jgi:hypothetical protein